LPPPVRIVVYISRVGVPRRGLLLSDNKPKHPGAVILPVPITHTDSSGHVVPKHRLQEPHRLIDSGAVSVKQEHKMNSVLGNDIKVQTKREPDLSLVIDGCAVSITSSPKGTDDPLKTVREILLSAYRTKQPQSLKTQRFFDVSGQK
jgi:hypothetical protein